MRVEAVLLLVVLAGCSGSAPEQPPEPVGVLTGIVVDALLQPIPGATVTVGEISEAVGEGGRYRMEANWTEGEHLVRFEAPGFLPETRTMVASTSFQQFHFNVTLQPIPVGRIDVQEYRGLVACGAIVQVGHSHGNGDPEEDNHIDCAPGRGQQRFELVPDPDVQDLMLELRWDAQTDLAQRMTLVLRNETGVISFDEGTSPLRMQFGRGQVGDTFEDGKTAIIQVLPGIPEESPGEVFVGFQFEQEFELFAVTGHGMDVPLDWAV